MFNPHARWDRQFPGGADTKLEPIEVLARFAKGRIVPISFLLCGIRCAVARVNYSWSERKGSNPRYYFSVTDARDTYCLCFDVEAMAWYLVAA